MFEKLIESLKNTGIPFREAAWSKAPATDYGVYALDGAGETLWGNNRMLHQAIEGTVDLFTHGPGREQAQTIQSALNEAGVSWALNSVQFEDDTRLTHWEWVFQMEGL